MVLPWVVVDSLNSYNSLLRPTLANSMKELASLSVSNEIFTVSLVVDSSIFSITGEVLVSSASTVVDEVSSISLAS